MKLEQEQIEAIRSYFRDKPVLRAYLFGSYARNEAGEESDVDILVELDYSRHIGLDFIGMNLDIETLLEKKLTWLAKEPCRNICDPSLIRKNC